MTFKPAELKMWGDGSYKPKDLEDGTPVVRKVNPMGQFCFCYGYPGVS